MRREIYPLARRLAVRLTKEQHARRRGALDFRRTVRASLATGGVPLETHHRPKRPHRTELVVLCDVSGSVANFAQFTLLLVYALREQFHKVRAFTFVDQVHEVTHHFTPGGDVVQVMENLAASTAHAARWGRTNYGRAFTDVRRGARRRPRAADLAARPGRRALQLQRPGPGHAARAGRLGAARVVAQPRAHPPLGHGRQRRPGLRRDRADGGVPQPRPAGRVRARHPLTAPSAGQEPQLVDARRSRRGPPGAGRRPPRVRRRRTASVLRSAEPS